MRILFICIVIGIAAGSCSSGSEKGGSVDITNIPAEKLDDYLSKKVTVTGLLTAGKDGYWIFRDPVSMELLFEDQSTPQLPENQINKPFLVEGILRKTVHAATPTMTPSGQHVQATGAGSRYAIEVIKLNFIPAHATSTTAPSTAPS